MAHYAHNKSSKDLTKVFVHWSFLAPLSQIWGLFTSMVLFGIGVLQLFCHHASIGLYIILASLGVFGLESYWILMKLRRKEKDCLSSTKYWQLLIDLQDPSNLWKKSVIYWLTSFLVFTKTKAAWLSQISGVQMIILSALYLLMCIQHQLKVHLLDVDKNRGPSKMMRQRCLSVFDQISMGLREGDEMEVFNTNEENLASDIEEEEEEEDPSLLKILSIDQDPMLIM